jgi:hypothetical protein
MSSPDEAAHLVRAISVSEGEWRGAEVKVPPGEQVTTEMLNSREFRVPERFGVVDASPCFAAKPTVTAACTPVYQRAGPVAQSYVGTYYPVLYGPLGLAARLTQRVEQAIYAERLVGSLACGLLLLGAWFCISGRWSKAAWLCAAGPLTFFVGSSAATNGIEVAASVCFVAASLSLAHRVERRGLWAIWTLSGVALASAKALGPVFVVFDLIAVALLAHRVRWWARGDRRALAGGAALLLACSANGLWSLLYVRSVSPLGPRFGHNMKAAAAQIVHLPRELYSDFGWQDTATPAHLWVFGSIAVAIVLWTAFARMGLMQRLWLCVLVLSAGAATYGVSVAGIAGSDALQARYTLALIAPLPLLAASTLRSSADKWRPLVVGILMVVVNAAALFGNARRYAVGSDGAVNFVGHARWNPPGGWMVVTAIGVVGLVGLLAGFLLDGEGDRAPLALAAQGAFGHGGSELHE